MFSLTTRVLGRAIVAALAFATAIIPASVRAEETGSYICPVLGSKIDVVSKETKSSDYHGVRYYFCCESCKPQFDKNQSKFLKSNKDKSPDRVIGVSLFDPITTSRIDPEKAATHSDYNGVRNFFAREDDKKTFDKEPKKYAAAPKKEVLFCPVSNEVVDSYDKASDYSDVKDTRYYFCCAGCKPQFDKDPDRYLEGLDARIKAKDPKKDDK